MLLVRKTGRLSLAGVANALHSTPTYFVLKLLVGAPHPFKSRFNIRKALLRVLLVRKTGLEPTQYCYHKNLNLARLPIPPFPQMTPNFLHESGSRGGPLRRFRNIIEAKPTITIFIVRRKSLKVNKMPQIFFFENVFALAQSLKHSFLSRKKGWIPCLCRHLTKTRLLSHPHYTPHRPSILQKTS